MEPQELLSSSVSRDFLKSAGCIQRRHIKEQLVFTLKTHKHTRTNREVCRNTKTKSTKANNPHTWKTKILNNVSLQRKRIQSPDNQSRAKCHLASHQTPRQPREHNVSPRHDPKQAHVHVEGLCESRAWKDKNLESDKLLCVRCGHRGKTSVKFSSSLLLH